MIPLAVPALGEEECAAAAAAIQSGWVAQGPRVAQFEADLGRICGAAHVVAVSSCTAALHLSLLASGIGPGDEVVCPSMSFIATANAIRHAGAEPIFADVDVATYNLDPDAVQMALTPRTKAILLVHQIGLPADLDRFRSLAAEAGVTLIEDAACALGSRYRGRPIGSGGLACFSFHPRKVITTGEGGAVAVESEELAAQLRLLRQHGMSVSDSARHAKPYVVIEEYLRLGYNYRMSDVQAAIGVEQLKKLPGILARRRELAARYSQALKRHAWLRPPCMPDFAEPNYQSYAIQLTDRAPMSRNELMQALLDRGIATRRGIMLAHREAPYAGKLFADLSRSQTASDRSLLLPLYPQMTCEQQDRVIAVLFELESPS